ncbi:MAG: ATPase domain-containing protein, partial [Thermoplasmata archaeon]
MEPEARISTGNAGLDEMLEGGVIPRRPYLIVGPAGTGKTTLALQFLCEGVRRGERGLLVTIEEPPNEARLNHRGLGPEFDRVEVFDAIPDVMRYERVPFKDISAVRSSMPFSQVPFVIRRTPELTGVEVTITALEQMLRSEVTRRGFSRVVIDSLTALQYFCMKGFNEVAGAQTFLRFLSDLQVTTFITVESPLEDVDTTERVLARGEIRLFRWELDNASVRAIGVEKFRGSSHDVRLHPYRIGPKGLDINLTVTISRDTRQIIEPVPLVTLKVPEPAGSFGGSPLDPLMEEVRDLAAIGADVGPVRTEIEAALAAVALKDEARAPAHIARASALAMDLSGAYRTTPPPDSAHRTPAVSEALMRVVARSAEARSGVAPTQLPPFPELERQLQRVLAELTPAPPTPLAAAVPVSPPPATPMVPPTPAPPTGRKGVPRAVTPVQATAPPVAAPPAP